MPKAAAPKPLPLAKRALVSEPGSAASAERDLCQVCELHRFCRTPFIRPRMPAGWEEGKKVLVIGEAPGGDEDKAGEFFVGAAGAVMRDAVRAAGLRESDVIYHNAVRCRPPKNATPKMKQIRACRPFVVRAIEVFKPSLVVAVGRVAMMSLLNKGQASVAAARGRPLEIEGLPGIPATATFHPAASLYPGGAGLEKTIAEDLKRATADPLPFPEHGPAGATLVALDVEWDTDTGRMLTMATASTKSAQVAEPPESLDEIAEDLRSARWLTGHSVMGDVYQALAHGLPVDPAWLRGDRVADSYLLARMVDENKASYELENLLADEARVNPWKYKTKDTVNAAQWDPELRRERCRLDAWASAVLVARYAPQLQKVKKLVNFTHRYTAVLSRMELMGAIVDRKKLEAYDASFRLQIEAAAAPLRALATREGMDEFVLTNADHHRELLYGRLKLDPPLGKSEKSGKPILDKTALLELISQGHDEAALLLNWRRLYKRHSVNIGRPRSEEDPEGTGLLGRVWDIGEGQYLIPTRINPLKARTGRRSSTGVNMQNWPGEMRPMVVSRFPGGVIAACDYRKLEPVVLAWVAKDDWLMHVFTKGDGYLEIARKLMGKNDLVDGSKEYRGVKSVVLGVHYYMLTKEMAKQLWYQGIRYSADYDEHVDEVDRLRSKYLRLARGVARYIELTEARLGSKQCALTATGRVRHLPVHEGERPSKRQVNQAVNFPVQGLAGEIMGSAEVDVEDELLKLYDMPVEEYCRGLIAQRNFLLTRGGGRGIMLGDIGTNGGPPRILMMPQPFNEVHDELTVDLPPGPKQKRDLECVVETMKAVPSFRALVPGFDVPLGVKVELGPYWAGKAPDFVQLEAVDEEDE